MEYFFDKTNEWVAWQWEKCKDKERKYCIAQTNYKHYKGGYGRVPLGNVLHMPWISLNNTQV
jgi:hypothetical protein